MIVCVWIHSTYKERLIFIGRMRTGPLQAYRSSGARREERRRARDRRPIISQPGDRTASPRSIGPLDRRRGCSLSWRFVPPGRAALKRLGATALGSAAEVFSQDGRNCQFAPASSFRVPLLPSPRFSRLKPWAVVRNVRYTLYSQSSSCFPREWTNFQLPIGSPGLKKILVNFACMVFV